nr:diaminopimelate decarboxylase [Sphingorhabdus sp.]
DHLVKLRYRNTDLARKGQGLGVERGIAQRQEVVQKLHLVAIAHGTDVNDLARPALYDAWHDFEAVSPTGDRFTANIVGPVCETGDTFAMGRDIDKVIAGDLAIFRTAGAYGATMASTYNSRGLVPEVLVSGDRYAVVAERIEPATILAAEHVPDWLA